jgi:dTDP-4-amino-4,6-dideoxygalactose transaminase
LISARKAVCDLYTELLDWSYLQAPEWVVGLERNYAYYPIVFQSEAKMMAVREVLNQNGIAPRRYFYPSLNKLSFVNATESCPVSEDVSLRVVCLPLHAELPHEDVRHIAALINQNL